MLFWIVVSGVPNHYKKDETYRNIGNALGLVDTVDVEGGRVRVFVNADEPLQFERRAGFANGDVIRVTLKYEDLHRHCFTCKLISHEEGTCPELTEAQRERNRVARIEQKDLEEKATREAFSIPARYEFGQRKQTGEKMFFGGRHEERETGRSMTADRNITNQDLRDRITEGREPRNKSVWKRLDEPDASYYPRDRERHHPYQRPQGNVSRTRAGERLRQSMNSRLLTWNSSERRYQNGSYHDSQSMNRSSPRRRGSPDSQRTIFAPYTFEREGKGRRNQARRSPPKVVQEWRPIRRTLNDDERRETNASECGETEDERRRRLKGKMIAHDDCPDPIRPLADRETIRIREPLPLQHLTHVQEGSQEVTEKHLNIRDDTTKASKERSKDVENRASPERSPEIPDPESFSEEEGEIDDVAF